MEAQQVRVPRVKLGSQGLETYPGLIELVVWVLRHIQVSRLGFGCAQLSHAVDVPLSHEDGVALIKEAFSKGITFFDTVDVYGNKDNEVLVGKALKQLPREKIQLATKFGIIMSEDFKFGVRGEPGYVRECCEASLKRLDVDYIDLYYQHRVDITVPIEDTMGELKKLVNEGKIKYIGLSEASPDTIRRAHAVHPITAVQMEYSLWSRDIEDELVPLCRELGIGIVAYSPLGSGFFAGTGVAEDKPVPDILGQVFPRFSPENMEKNKSLFMRLSELAAKYGCSTPQLALAWLLHQGNDIVPIPGTTKVKNLESNIKSMELKLATDNLKKITDVVQVNEVSGSRGATLLAKYSWQVANTPPKC